MKNLYKRPLASVLGIIAISAVIGLGLSACPTDDGGDDGGVVYHSGEKPETLATSATLAQALAKLDEIIAHPNTPAATKTAAETLKAELSAGGDLTTAIATINDTLISAIPEPRILVITGIDVAKAAQASSGILIGIFPAGTSSTDASNQKGLVAGADSNAGSVELSGSSPSYTATAHLYIPHTTTKWASSGTYDIYLILTSGSGETYYRKQNVPFSSTTTTVAATDFSSIL
jgi:hypothetical protein